MNEFKFPIPLGTVSLSVPYPMTEEDFNQLMAILYAAKPGLVGASLTGRGYRADTVSLHSETKSTAGSFCAKHAEKHNPL